jgi:hypothetical protein
VQEREAEGAAQERQLLECIDGEAAVQEREAEETESHRCLRKASPGMHRWRGGSGMHPCVASPWEMT